MVEQRPGVFLIVCQVIHARADHTQCTGYQQCGPTTLAAMSRHIRHFAVKIFGEPFRQAFFRLLQIDIAEADLLKSEFPSPLADFIGEQLRILSDLL